MTLCRWCKLDNHTGHHTPNGCASHYQPTPNRRIELSDIYMTGACRACARFIARHDTGKCEWCSRPWKPRPKKPTTPKRRTPAADAAG